MNRRVWFREVTLEKSLTYNRGKPKGVCWKWRFLLLVPIQQVWVKTEICILSSCRWFQCSGLGPNFDKDWPEEKPTMSQRLSTIQEQCCSVLWPLRQILLWTITLSPLILTFLFSRVLMIGFSCSLLKRRKWTALSTLAFEIIWMSFSSWTNKATLGFIHQSLWAQLMWVYPWNLGPLSPVKTGYMRSQSWSLLSQEVVGPFPSVVGICPFASLTSVSIFLYSTLSFPWGNQPFSILWFSLPPNLNRAYPFKLNPRIFVKAQLSLRGKT